MSLASRVSLLATRIGDECQSLWTAVNSKAASIFYNGLATSLAVKERRNVLVYSMNTANTTGSLVINTGITFNNRMTSLRIRGYNHLSNDSILDWVVNFYAVTTPAISTHSVLLRGDYGPSAIRLMRNPGTNTVVVVIDTSTDWDYPKIAVDVMVGHGLTPDSELDPVNWTASIGATIDPTFVLMATPTLQRNLRNTLNLSDLSSAATALVNLGVTATAAELNKLDGALPTVTEINYLDGVTSAIQTQLNAKEAAANKSTNTALGTSDVLFPTQNAVRAYIATEALNPPGVIFAYGGMTIPTGYLYCDGAAVSRTTYADLFAAIVKATTGNTTISSTSVTSVASTTGVEVGMPISGPGIPAGATVTAIGAGTFTLSAAATATATGVALKIAPYGVGDGSTTFNVPDGRVRGLRGHGTGQRLGDSDGVAEASRNANWSHSHGHTASSSSSGSTSTGSTGTGTTGSQDTNLAGALLATTTSDSAGTPSGSVSLNLAATNLTVSTASNTTTGGTAARVTSATGTTAGNHSHAGSTASFAGSALGTHDHNFTPLNHFHAQVGHSIPSLSIPSLGVSVSTSTTVNSGGSAEHPNLAVKFIIKT